MLYRLLVVLLALVALGCDATSDLETGESGMDGPEVQLTPVSTVELTNGVMRVLQDRNYRFRHIRLVEEPGGSVNHISGSSAVGLWMATADGGFRSNQYGTLNSYLNGYSPVIEDGQDGGIYHVNRESLKNVVTNWPWYLGAPTSLDRSPHLLGDRMTWIAERAESGSGSSWHGLAGVHVGKAVFMFDQGSLAQAVFVRFDITNATLTPLHELHLGVGADLDIYFSGSHDCGDIWVDDNSSGLDMERGLSYVYNQSGGWHNVPADCYGYVAGFAILDLSTPTGLRQPLLAHRIIREGNNLEYPNYSERLINTDERVLWAMQGLDPNGDPMIDPTTQSPTKFAFTGDPVADTGWIDARHDLRSLLSIEPIDLEPAETRSLQAVFIIEHGDDLADGLSRLKARFDEVLALRQLWDQ